MIALLTVTSEKKGAFGSRVVGEIIPVKSMAAMALAQHLHRARTADPAAQEERAMRNAASEFQDRIRHLRQHTAELEQENREKAARLESLTHEIEQLDRSSNGYRDELARVKGMLRALEEQSAEATDHLNSAFEQLHEATARGEHLQRTITFLKDVFQVLAQEHDPQEFSSVMVSWFCENFGVERCSLMLLDDARESMRIAAHQGIDPDVAGSVRVRVGQGIAGWVAHNRKPLFIRVREDSRDVSPTGQDAYNSDSFIVVPLIHNDRLCGVLNLSNKRDGEPFDELDLDRATLAGSVMAMSLGGYETARRVAAWA
jgi:putative methionine-R-sulfoxide reductase with GAF domain